MKFTPVNSTFTFEPITTPNKNIQSYFMRSEQSFFTPEAFKYPSYPSTDIPAQLLILDGVVRMNIGSRSVQTNIEAESATRESNPEGIAERTQDSETEQVSERKAVQEFLVGNRMNIGKYQSRQRCIDGLYTVINGVSKGIARTTPVQLIISDFLGRSDIIALIDVLMNQLGFMAVMVLPFSLCLSFQLGQNYSVFIYKEGVSFIDDFCLVDARSPSREPIRPDDEDFAEEYSRLTLIDESLSFSCDECSQKEETEEKIAAHIQKEHETATYFEYKKKEDPLEDLWERMRYLFNKEKYEKISKRLYGVGVQLEGVETVENAVECGISGAQAFGNLECSKELWMSDHEWRNVRLRVLKEKILFYI